MNLKNIRSTQNPSALTGMAIALVLGFAAGCAYSTVKADKDGLPETEYIGAAPSQYFPGRYENQAKEVEALPPQF